MWPFKKANYPVPAIPPKALELINIADKHLVEQSVSNECDLFILERQISLTDQFKPIKLIVNHITKDVTGYYLPRSIAFYTAPDGTWCFLIGIRCNQINTANTGMWLHILTQTNAARILNQPKYPDRE